jgi:hypothetical protein
MTAQSDPSQRGALSWRIVLGSAAVVLAAGLLVRSGLFSGAPVHSGDAEVHPDPVAAAEMPAIPERDAPPARSESGGRSVASGETLVLEAASLPAGEALVVHLLLPEPPDGDAPHAVRVLALDGRQLETRARVLGGDRRGVALELDPTWLEPGRYIVELETTEKTHFPLRRYVVEVR